MATKQALQQAITERESLGVIHNMIKICISEVCFSRGVLPESEFVRKTFSNAALSMQRIKRDGISLRSEILKSWLDCGIAEAISKKYVKSITFQIMKSAEDPADILEAYEFNISYGKLIDIKVNGNAIKPIVMSKDFAESLATTFFRRLVVYLGTFEEKLDADLPFAIKLEYDESITPRDYEPPSFRQGPDKVAEPSNGASLLGVIQTNFHRLDLQTNTPVPKLAVIESCDGELEEEDEEHMLVAQSANKRSRLVKEKTVEPIKSPINSESESDLETQKKKSAKPRTKSRSHKKKDDDEEYDVGNPPKKSSSKKIPLRKTAAPAPRHEAENPTDAFDFVDTKPAKVEALSAKRRAIHTEQEEEPQTSKRTKDKVNKEEQVDSRFISSPGDCELAPVSQSQLLSLIFSESQMQTQRTEGKIADPPFDEDALTAALEDSRPPTLSPTARSSPSPARAKPTSKKLKNSAAKRSKKVLEEEAEEYTTGKRTTRADTQSNGSDVEKVHPKATPRKKSPFSLDEGDLPPRSQPSQSQKRPKHDDPPTGAFEGQYVWLQTKPGVFWPAQAVMRSELSIAEKIMSNKKNVVFVKLCSKLVLIKAQLKNVFAIESKTIEEASAHGEGSSVGFRLAIDHLIANLPSDVVITIQKRNATVTISDSEEKSKSPVGSRQTGKPSLSGDAKSDPSEVRGSQDTFCSQGAAVARTLIPVAAIYQKR